MSVKNRSFKPVLGLLCLPGIAEYKVANANWRKLKHGQVDSGDIVRRSAK